MRSSRPPGLCLTADNSGARNKEFSLVSGKYNNWTNKQIL